MVHNPYPATPVLVVDDENEILSSVSIALRSSGITHVVSCQDSREVMPLLAKQEVCVILLDLTLPHITGNKLLSNIRMDYPEIPVVIVTGNDELENAVHCMKTGAFDYMVKPLEKSRLISGVMRAIEMRELAHENKRLQERFLADKLENPEAFSEIISVDARMHALFQYAEAISKSAQPILITGESGVGKELMAKAVHQLSRRRGAFVPVNAAGIDDQIFSDTLFGHVRGAFTGADTLRKGLVETAAGGTLFLDEIGDLAMDSQVKLLRLIQEREYYPVGADLPKSTDTQLVVATNQDLKAGQSVGRFRKDLYFRLTAHHIHIPPLRERAGDLPLLLDHFFEEAARAFGKKKPAYPEELLVLIKNYHFPGNVRELRSMVYDALAGHQAKKISMERFKAHIDTESDGTRGLSVEIENESIRFPENLPLPTLARANQRLIEEALHRSGGNRSIAARLLGISRQRLMRHLKADDE
jgi:DNA-binding NtrC family response regulator